MPTFSCFPVTKDTTVMNTSTTSNIRTDTNTSSLICFLQKPLFLNKGPLPRECTTLKTADNLTATYLGIPFFWLIHNEDGNCNECVKSWENLNTWYAWNYMLLSQVLQVLEAWNYTVTSFTGLIALFALLSTNTTRSSVEYLPEYKTRIFS